MTKRWVFGVALSACISWLAVMGGAAAQELLNVRFGPDGDKTRVVLDIAGAQPSYALSGAASGNGRLVIDFKALSVGSGYQSYKTGKGHIGRYGFSVGAGKNAQATLDFKKTARVKEAFLLEPKGTVKHYRLVIDLVTSDKGGFLASVPSQFPDLGKVIEQATATPDVPEQAAPPTPQQKQVAKPAPEKQAAPEAIEPDRKYVVVIDPGHGGRDPGAQGQSGTLEKQVNLAAAMELKRQLEKKKRYEVVLTRQTDEKIKPDRVEEMARAAHADLFISLHADAIASRAVRGGSVYTLSSQGSERAAKLAKESGNYTVYDLDVARYGNEVGDMLFDLAQGETNSASSKFAEILLKNLTGKTPLLGRSHRKGDLRVLLAPDVPAVLFEMAFISNAKDEANLNSPVWRKRTMAAVAKSIDEYFEEVGPRRFASNRPRGAN